VSLQTTLAEGAARDAEAKWARHRGAECAQCDLATRRRRPADRCGFGSAFAAAAAELRAEAQEQKRLDRLPNPNQGQLDLGLAE
jgi:hypothetical protein